MELSELIVPSIAPSDCGARTPNEHSLACSSGKWKLRLVQKRLIARARWLKENPRDSTVCVGACGCGKSAGVAYFYWELYAAKLARWLLWVVPNETLAKQVRKAITEYLGPRYHIHLPCSDPDDRVGHALAKNGKECPIIQHHENPYCLGVVLTYQQLIKTVRCEDGLSQRAAALWVQRMSAASKAERDSGRWGGTLVVWDEGHHLADPKDNFEPEDPTDQDDGEAVDVSARPWGVVAHEIHHGLVIDDDGGNGRGHSLITTGTLERDDHYGLPNVYYCADHDPKNASCSECSSTSGQDTFVGPSKVVLGPGRRAMRMPHVHVEVTYKEAYDEGSLKRIVSLPLAVSSTWFKRGPDGESTGKPITKDTDDPSLPRAELNRAIRTANSRSEEATVEAMRHWLWWREETGSPWLMLVVCRNQEAAADLALRCMAMNKTVRVGLAISVTGRNGKAAFDKWKAASGDQTSGRKVLKKFRGGAYDILVTVNMAQEGYDVPRISHVLFLTDFRTCVYCLQTFMRGARACLDDKIPAQDQPCFICTLSDNKALAYVETLERMISLVRPALVGYMPAPTHENRDEKKKRVDEIIPVGAKLKRGRKAPEHTRPKTEDEQRRADIWKWLKNFPKHQAHLRKQYGSPRYLSGNELLKAWSYAFWLADRIGSL